MAGEPDRGASDLGPAVHLAGLPALCCRAHPGLPRGGEVDPAGVRLFCSYHPDHGGLWRLCGRYTQQAASRLLSGQLQPVSVALGPAASHILSFNISVSHMKTRCSADVFHLPGELFKAVFLKHE